MRILLTGNTGYLTHSWIKNTFAGHRVLVAGDTQIASQAALGIGVIASEEVDYFSIFEAHDFDFVVFFSNQLTFHTRKVGELERLQQLIDVCRSHTPVRLLYLSGPKAAKADAENAVSLAAQQLCQHENSEQLSIRVVQLLHLYSAEYPGDYFYHMFECLERDKHFSFDATPGQAASFLSMDDLSELVRRLFAEWPGSSQPMAVPECFGLKFADIEHCLHQINEDWKLEYDMEASEFVPTVHESELREQYGWFPRYSLAVDLPAMAERYQRVKPKKLRLFERISDWRGRHKTLFMLIELLAAVLLTLLCGSLSKWQVQFSLIDFRLLLVIIMGTMYGMKMGFAAALAASVMLLVAYQNENAHWLTLFYEPTNWIPFIAYFVVGTVCGYLRLLDKDKLRFVEKDNEQLREKLVFAQGLYQDVLSDKRDYKKQIIGSKDSFGKIFNIARQLDVTHDKEVFLQAVQILEKIMDNKSIALYALEGNGCYARLMAASREIGMSLPVSITMDDYSAALAPLEHGEVFANTNMLEGYPMYMMGIRHEDRICMVVMIREAQYEQMTLYYQNLFKVLCGLIGSALTHTMEYQEALRRQQCVPHTNILKMEWFEEKLRIEQQMGEQRIAMHLLLRLKYKRMSLEELDKLLSTRVRTCDTVGLARDGEVYLILAQATHQALPIIEKRLREVGITCENINLEEVK